VPRVQSSFHPKAPKASKQFGIKLRAAS
jgi:hypothetical protein